MWPFNYPGDEYATNTFSQVISLVEDIKDVTIDYLTELKEEITNELV